jgi:small subunit ribosomal protein S9
MSDDLQNASAEDTQEPETPDVEMPGTLASGLTLGEGAPADETEPDFKPVIRGKIDRFGAAMGTGRRKTSVARVRVKDGDGQMTINGRELTDYFPTERDQQMVQAPLKATQTLGKVDVWVRVNGGGTTGQTGAILLGIARALQARDANLHHQLADGGYLTRDGRMVERKKYGFKKARRSFQFSKR